MVQISTNSNFDGPDHSILANVGNRVAAARLRRNISQQQLADEAGVSRSTVRRLEAGESTQLTAFIRILRALEMLEGLELLLPAATPSPMQVLENRGKTRQRASSPRDEADTGTEADAPNWEWGDDS